MAATGGVDYAPGADGRIVDGPRFAVEYGSTVGRPEDLESRDRFGRNDALSRSVGVADHFLKNTRRKKPFVQVFAANAQRIVETLIRTGTKPIE